MNKATRPIAVLSVATDRRNETDIIETLRERGADSTLKDKLGLTAKERAHGEANPREPP